MVAAAFIAAVDKLQSQIDEAALRSALAGGNADVIEAAVAAGGDLGAALSDEGIEHALYNTATATGNAGAEILSGVTGLEAQFNASDPRVVLFARRQAADLVVAVSDDVREAIRIVISLGEEQGVTVAAQARVIRSVVGLPPNWAQAPLNLAQELRQGRFTSTRRLSATDKAQIRSRLAKGTVDEDFIAQMQDRYARSLINLRARTIARTETARASMHGTRENWRQSVEQGVLPPDVRRVFIVTPDDRLRPEHAAVPSMNEGGVGLDEPFQTPLGPMMGPPLEPACRCSEGLIFPGLAGAL